jgi:hypothetical protein
LYLRHGLIVLRGDEETMLLSNETIAPLWHAIDIVKHYRISIVDITTSGMGSKGNPTRFYAIMSK